LDAVVRYNRLRTCYKDAMNNPDCGYIEMNEGEEWDYIVSSKKKLLKSIGNNMMAIQSSKLKLAAVFRSFETILSRKQQWKNVRLDETYLDLTNLIYQDRAFMRGVIKIQNRSIQLCNLKSTMLSRCLRRSGLIILQKKSQKTEK